MNEHFLTCFISILTESSVKYRTERLVLFSMSSCICKTKQHFNLIFTILHHLSMPLSNLPVILFSQAVCVSVKCVCACSEIERGKECERENWRASESVRAKAKVIQLYQSSWGHMLFLLQFPSMPAQALAASGRDTHLGDVNGVALSSCTRCYHAR